LVRNWGFPAQSGLIRRKSNREAVRSFARVDLMAGLAK
jgi:hypothetical protein